MARYKYLLLLAALLLVLFAVPLLTQANVGRGFLTFLISLLILAGTHVILRVAPRAGWLALPLAGLVLAFNGLEMFGIPLTPRTQMVAHLAAALFLFLTLVLLLTDVYRQSAISLDGISAALCGYMVLGAAFSHLYALLLLRWPGSFTGAAAQELAAADMHRQQMLLTYVSFQALTTMGFSDLVPHGVAVRGLAILEAVAGQFYLAVLLADLVGKRLSAGPRRAEAG